MKTTLQRMALWALGLALIGTFSAPAVFAQGILVTDDPAAAVRLPRPIRGGDRLIAPPAGSYRIRQLGVQARIVDQAATGDVSQSFVNVGSQQLEVCFVFPLPD